MTRLRQNAQASGKVTTHFLRRTYHATDDWARRAAVSVNRSMSYTDSFDATPGSGGGYAAQRQTYPPTPGYGGGQWFQPTTGSQAVITGGTTVMSRPAYASAERGWRDDLVGARRGPGALTGAMAGVLAAALAVGVATLVSAFVRPQSSPLIAVGQPFIDRTPPSLMRLATTHFGSHANLAAVAFVAVVIAVIAMIIGVLAVRRPAAGVTGMALLALFGAFAVITRPGSMATDAAPSLIGGAAGVVALMWLIRIAYRGARA
jgi:hypothetical protein